MRWTSRLTSLEKQETESLYVKMDESYKRQSIKTRYIPNVRSYLKL